MKRILLISIIAIAIIGGLIYFLRNPAKTPSGQNQAPEVSVTGKTYDIAAVNFAFNPAVLGVEKGDRVVWTNLDSAPHDISGDSFKSKFLSESESFSFTFDSAGDYEYICSIHPYMKGKIIVK